MKVNITKAKKRLPELIKAVGNGESVTICRRGVPVVDLVRTTAHSHQKPKFGTMKDKIIVHDPDWWKPMTEDETDAFLEGRY